MVKEVTKLYFLALLSFSKGSVFSSNYIVKKIYVQYDKVGV